MNHAEITVLTALCPVGRVIRNPWRHTGFLQMARYYLPDHTVLMGREAWFDLPQELKENPRISPWVLSSNQGFQLRTKAQYPHVHFTDDLNVLTALHPLKGIWWVLGGFKLYRAVFKYCHAVEAVVVPSTLGAVDLLSKQELRLTSSCINPFDRQQKCVRYERTQDTQFSMQEMQTAGIR